MSIPTSYEDFERTLQGPEPTVHWPESLKALWWAAKGVWERSHDIAQDLPTKTGSWIHGYLHRVEGDQWNARYWYDRANRPFSKLSHEEELKKIVSWVLENPK